MSDLITRIQPSIIATSLEELRARLADFPIGFQTLHLDAMVPPFVENHSLDFKDMDKAPVWCSEARYSLHIMSGNPSEYLKNFPMCFLDRTDTIIIHYETEPGQAEIMSTKVRCLGRKFGLAIKPETNVREILDFISYFDEVLVMTVHPGQSGAPFLEDQLSKVYELREEGFPGIIGVDGGLSERTIERIAQARPDYVVAGSSMQKAGDEPKHKLAAARHFQDFFK
jgi:ribulose-phosphate 3-epimerase